MPRSEIKRRNASAPAGLDFLELLNVNMGTAMNAYAANAPSREAALKAQAEETKRESDWLKKVADYIDYKQKLAEIEEALGVSRLDADAWDENVARVNELEPVADPGAYTPSYTPQAQASNWIKETPVAMAGPETWGKMTPTQRGMSSGLWEAKGYGSEEDIASKLQQLWRGVMYGAPKFGRKVWG